MTEMIAYSLNGKVAEIQLQNGKVNAFSPAFIEAINQALDQAEKDQAAVLFIGNRGIFSAGYDLKIFQDGDPEAVANMIQAGSSLCRRLLAFPRPVVSAVTGHAMAQGVMFLTACDYNVGTAGKFTIGLNESQIGMIMPQYGVELTRARFPINYWTRAIINAELFTPETAVHCGVLDQVVAAENLMEVARAEAQRLADLDPKAFLGTKLKIRGDLLQRMDAAYEQDDKDLRDGSVG